MEDLLAHRQWVRKLARSLAADESRAGDLEQETWLAAALHPPRDARSPRGWLGAVMRNIQRNERRGDFRRDRRERAVARPETADVAPDVVAEAEEQTLLVREVLALDEPYRTTVLLRWFEDLTPQQIAERQSVPLETVRTRLKRAVERLRGRMDERHGGDRRAWCLLLMGRDDGPGTGVASQGTTAAQISTAGGLAMATTTKYAIAATVLVALGAGLWWTRSDVAPPPAGPAQKDAASVAPAPSPAPKHERRASAADETAASAPTTLDIAKVDRDLDLHGVVVRADGSPVVGATVLTVDYPWRRTMTMNVAAWFEGTPGASTKSADGGAFALRLRRGQSRNLRVSADGLATREIGPFQAGERVKVVMTAAVTLHVAVRDEAGAPVVGATLWLIGFGARGDQPWVSVRADTDAAGKRDFAGLPGGAQLMVLPQRGAGDWGGQRVALPADGETSLDVVSPAGRTLRGRVFDAVTLAPVAGAKVGLGKAAICATTSDGGGRFELRGFTGKSERNVVVSAAGYASTALPAPTTDAEVEFSMRRGFAAAGRIVDVDGKPLAGVHVAVEASQRGEGVDRTSCGFATTDADGRFRAADLDRSMAHVLSASADGRGRARQSVLPPRDDADASDVGDVRMSPPRAIEGVAVKQDGSPWAGAEVQLTGPNVAQAAMPEVGARETRRTDDLGRFRFGDLAPGAYTVELQDRNATPQPARVTLTADRDVLDVVLPPKPTGESIVVRVVDESGAPVAGMNVIGGQSVVARTDAAGRAVLAPPAKGKITRIDVGAQTDEQAFLRNPPIKVEPGKGEYVVTMEKGAHVACRLLDVDGNPLPRASISVEPGERAYYFSMPDADGRFRVTIPRRGEFSIVFHGCVYVGDKSTPTDSHMEARADGVTAQSGEVLLRCRRVETGRSTTVRVLAADGSPVVGEEVRLFAYAGTERKAKTDAEGRARFDDLPAREFHVNVQFKAGSLAPPPTKLVPSGQEVVLAFPAAASISGSVVWASGQAASGASVTVLGDDLLVFMTNADRDGRFTVQVPAGDTRKLRIDAFGVDGATRGGATREVSLQDRDVRIELKPN
jgi:RNA polymerase sigma-70 factor (ECF subfamily)